MLVYPLFALRSGMPNALGWDSLLWKVVMIGDNTPCF